MKRLLLLVLVALNTAACPSYMDKGKKSSPSCTNQKQDGDETDQDCGGSCSPCADGLGCNKDTDCSSGSCREGLCLAAASSSSSSAESSSSAAGTSSAGTSAGASSSSAGSRSSSAASGTSAPGSTSSSAGEASSSSAAPSSSGCTGAECPVACGGPEPACPDGRVCHLRSGWCVAPGGSCDGDGDCGHTELCVQGTCAAVTTCMDSSGCPPPLVCQVSTATCRMPGAPCQAAAACGDGETCIAWTGRCTTLPACSPGCPAGLVCHVDSARCQLANGPCAVDTDCGAAEVCLPVDGHCAAPGGPCATTASCGGGQVCHNGSCQSPSVGTCSADTPACTDGMVCNLATGRCQPPESACTATGAGCGVGEVCLPSRRVCGPVPGCSAGAPECPAGLLCNPAAGACQWPGASCPSPGCAVGESCQAGTCGPAACGTGCAAGSQCNPLTLTCQPVGAACAAGGDCLGGEWCDGTSARCVSVPCAAGGACPTGLACQSGRGVCLAPGSPCAFTADCLGGEDCVSGTCQASCGPGVGCPTGQVCNDTTFLCQPAGGACTLSSQCGRTEACNAVTGACAATCRTNADCPVQQVCGRSGTCQSTGVPCSQTPACGMTEVCGTTGTCEPAPVVRLGISPLSFTVQVGAAAQVYATAYDAQDRAVAGVQLAWSTSDPRVAGVDAAGLVTGVGGGTARVSAHLGTLDSPEVTVSVPYPPLQVPVFSTPNPSPRVTFTPDSRWVYWTDGNGRFLPVATPSAGSCGGEPFGTYQPNTQLTMADGYLAFGECDTWNSGCWGRWHRMTLSGSCPSIPFTTWNKAAPANPGPAYVGFLPGVDLAGSWWFASGDLVYVFDAVGSVPHVITDPALTGIQSFVVSPDGLRVFAYSSSGLVVVDALARTVESATAITPTLGSVYQASYRGTLAVSPDGATVYGTSIVLGKVVAVDVAVSPPVVKQVQGGLVYPTRVTVSPAGNYLYVGSASSTQKMVTVLRAADLSVVTQVSTVAQPLDVALSPDGNWAAAISPLDQKVALWGTNGLN